MLLGITRGRWCCNINMSTPPCIYALSNRLFSFVRKEILAPTLYVASLYSSDNINISHDSVLMHNQTYIIILSLYT